MEKTATLNLRVNPAVKENAEAVLSKLGIPMSISIRFPLQEESRFRLHYRRCLIL